MLDAILNNLWNNWMFRLSLSSNELFHSNFLQTVLSDPLPDMADEHAGASSWDRIGDFAGWIGLDAAWLAERAAAYAAYPVFVYREWKKLDLAVVVRVPRTQGGFKELVIFAVELKIKSYPTLEQLERYRERIAKHNGRAPFVPKLVLLSLVPPPAHFGLIENVSIADFGTLANGIALVVPAHPPLQAAIDEYARLCQLLHQLSEVWNASLNPQTLLQTVTGQANLYRRLNPIWSKLCAAYLCELVSREMASFAPADGIALEVKPDFSRSTWRADFLWATDPASHAAGQIIAKVGIQVEGNTIRFMLNAQNVGGNGMDARAVVQATLLAQAAASGLYQRLHALYDVNEEAAADQVAEVGAFWKHTDCVTRDRTGLPTRGWGLNGYTLPGYNNSPTFGHADYRLTLRPDATLEQISQLICAALRGAYNAGGANAFVAVLNQPGIFTQAHH